jgi:hypothetical protein
MRGHRWRIASPWSSVVPAPVRDAPPLFLLCCLHCSLFLLRHESRRAWRIQEWRPTRFSSAMNRGARSGSSGGGRRGRCCPRSPALALLPGTSLAARPALLPFSPLP